MHGALRGACLIVPAGLSVALSITLTLAQPLVLKVERAVAASDQRTSEPVITFTLDQPSARLFSDLTARNVGKMMEIRIDGQVIIRSAIREPILGGTGQISGGFTAESARDIAARLSSGAAKLELEVVSSN
jgi:preprotein translocase subunit SecD